MATGFSTTIIDRHRCARLWVSDRGLGRSVTPHGSVHNWQCYKRKQNVCWVFFVLLRIPVGKRAWGLARTITGRDPYKHTSELFALASAKIVFFVMTMTMVIVSSNSVGRDKCPREPIAYL